MVEYPVDISHNSFERKRIVGTKQEQCTFQNILPSFLIVYCVIHSFYAIKTLTNATQAMTVKRFALILLVDTSALVMRGIN